MTATATITEGFQAQVDAYNARTSELAAQANVLIQDWTLPCGFCPGQMVRDAEDRDRMNCSTDDCISSGAEWEPGKLDFVLWTIVMDELKEEAGLVRPGMNGGLS